MTLAHYDILESLEQKLWQKDFRYSYDWMDAILTDDFVEFGRSGQIYDRETILTARPRDRAIFPSCCR